MIAVSSSPLLSSGSGRAVSLPFPLPLALDDPLGLGGGDEGLHIALRDDTIATRAPERRMAGVPIGREGCSSCAGIRGRIAGRTRRMPLRGNARWRAARLIAGDGGVLGR